MSKRVSLRSIYSPFTWPQNLIKILSKMPLEYAFDPPKCWSPDIDFLKHLQCVTVVTSFCPRRGAKFPLSLRWQRPWGCHGSNNHDTFLCQFSPILPQICFLFVILSWVRLKPFHFVSFFHHFQFISSNYLILQIL